MRADQLLVQRGLAPTRSAAQRLIERAAVRWRVASRADALWSSPRKAGENLPDGCELQVVDDAELRWASRAGLKLEAALAHLKLNVQGRQALDIGQSTGGFTDVLLAQGAAHVVGVDVGHAQLAERLRADPRVTVIEGVNARHLDAAMLRGGPFDLVVADLSFISLTLVLPALAPLVAGDALLLVKPQFELQPAQIGKGGLVNDPDAPALVEARIRKACEDHHLIVLDWFDSPVPGGDGNREFFAHARRMRRDPTGDAR